MAYGPDGAPPATRDGGSDPFVGLTVGSYRASSQNDVLLP